MSALFLELVRTILFFSSSLPTFRLRTISSMVVIAPHKEVAKTLPVVRLATHKLIMSIDPVVGVELLSTTLAGKHITSVLPNLCWLDICKDLKAFLQTLQGCTLSLSCAVSPHNDPIQQQYDFPHKPTLDTCRPSCEQMSTPIQ